MKQCKYEYDIDDFFAPCKYSGEVDYEVIGNINDKKYNPFFSIKIP